MPEKNPPNHTHGFVGLASLIGVTFLLVATLIGVNVVNDRNITLNMNNKAEDVYTSTCNVSLISSLGCGASGCTETQMAQKWKTVTCDENVICVENADCKVSTPTSSCDCVYGKLTGTGCGASNGMACSVNATPTPTVRPTQTPSPTNTAPPPPPPVPTTAPTCDCVYGKLTGTGCGASNGMACSVNATPTPTPKPSPTPTPIDLSAQIGQTPTPACVCVNGKYVGIACGHSAGYPCSEAPNVCEATTCSTKCASQVAGNIGTCVSGGCVCSAPKLKDNGYSCSSGSECSSGNCYAGNQTLGGSPLDSTTTCHATSIAAMDTTVRDLNTNTAIGMSAELGAIVAAPVVADIAGLAAANGGLSALPSAIYSYGTAAITTLPASVQTAMAVGGTVAGYAGATVGTVACIKDPYSEACTSYVGALQGDPMAMIQLGQATDNIYNNISTTAKLQAIRNESIKQGKYFEYIVPENNSLGSLTYEKSVAGEVGNTYDDLLGTIKRTMAEDGVGPVEAMSDVIRTYNPKVFTPIDASELAYTVKDETALSARLVCGNRLNCIELPVLEKNLLIDLGVPESQVQVIVGFGGSTGLPNYPNMHGALQVGDQVVGYYATPVNQTDFYRYANKLEWGNFGLPGFDASEWKAIASPG